MLTMDTLGECNLLFGHLADILGQKIEPAALEEKLGKGGALAWLRLRGEDANQDNVVDYDEFINGLVCCATECPVAVLL